MWEPLLTFLTRIPNVWIRATDFSQGSGIEDLDEADEAVIEDSEHDDDHEEHSEGETESPEDTLPVGADSSNAQPWPFTQFLDFVKAGCGGSPIQGYPTLIVILSTIPVEVRYPFH